MYHPYLENWKVVNMTIAVLNSNKISCSISERDARYSKVCFKCLSGAKFKEAYSTIGCMIHPNELWLNIFLIPVVK